MSHLTALALPNTAARRDDVVACILQPGRGSPFHAGKYVYTRHRYGVAGAMGRVCPCRDNGAMEAFFSLL